MPSKAEWRQTLLQKRLMLAQELPKTADALRDRLVSLIPFKLRAVIAGYWPYRGEIDVRPALHAFHEKGLICALPVVMGSNQPLLFRRWYPEMDLIPGEHNIPVPPPTSPTLIPTVLLVPLVGFDRRGYRLGYGAGHYDRTLQKLRTSENPVQVIGVAFSGQEISAVPHEPHDEPLDGIVTEAYSLSFREYNSLA